MRNRKSSCLFKKKTGCQATGIDRDKNRIDFAQKAYPSINFILSDIFNFQSKRKFDLIFVSAFIQNIKDFNFLLQIINRFLVTGGFFAIITTTPLQIARFPEYKLIPRLFDYDKKRFLGKGDIIFNLVKEGFRNIDWKYVTLLSQKYNADYLKYIKSKPYSAMYNISDNDFNAGLILLKNDINRNRNKIIHKNGVLVIAQK